MIRLFITDLDGCLTDGGYYVFSEQAGIAKKFYTRDFYGMERLSELGVKIAIVSAATSACLQQQIGRSAKYLHTLTSVRDKVKQVSVKLLEPGGFSWSETAYIGDDLNDLESLHLAGLAACPADAHADILELIEQRDDGFRMNSKGGHGCVREFADLVLHTQIRYNASGK